MAGGQTDKRILFISNGHGEDAIAAQIARRLPTGMVAEAYPTLGAGHAYDGVCPVVGPRAELPSEGWRNVRGSVLRDLGGGGLGTLLPGIRFFRSLRGRYHRIVVVGDMIGVYGCFLGGLREIVYVDVYKTGFGRSYLTLDKGVLKAVARTVFCRAEPLAAALRRWRIDARAAGNVMMDTIPRTGWTPERAKLLSVAVLPGSRTHAAENFALQTAAFERLRELPDIFVAVAGGVDLPRHPGMTFVPGTALGDVLDAADLVLSQAGTATVQAIGLGKPVITFRNAHDRASRFDDEQRLFGEARQVVPADPGAIAERMTLLLGNAPERRRLGDIGRERVGGAGALGEILAALE